MKIIVDAMGGDNAPRAAVLGAMAASKEYGVDIVLVGRSEEILECLQNEGMKTLPEHVEVAFASQVVTMGGSPTSVLHESRDSSMVVGMKLLADGGGDAFVSAGNTGALLTTATLVAKRIKGIRRAAVAPVIPSDQGEVVLIDAGANNDCTPEYLLQFAYMGALYAEKYLGKRDPRVGLLNNGAEEGKGRELQQDTYALLQQAAKAGNLNFCGNVEGRDVPTGAVDVVVADGFSGNVLLKTMEGTALFMSHQMKKMFSAGLRGKLGYLLCKNGVADIKRLLDYRETGGTMFLGITKPVVKAHGSSDDYAMKNAIHQALLAAETGVAAEIAKNVDKMQAEPAHAED